MPFFEHRTVSSPEDDGRLRPGEHRCDLSDLDYSRVDEGRIVCRVCTNNWSLTGNGRWLPMICPGCRFDARRCRHYGPKRGGR